MVVHVLTTASDTLKSIHIHMYINTVSSAHRVESVSSDFSFFFCGSACKNTNIVGLILSQFFPYQSFGLPPYFRDMKIENYMNCHTTKL